MKSIKSILNYSVTFVFIAGFVLILLNKQAVSDYIVLWNYEPAQEIVTAASVATADKTVLELVRPDVSAYSYTTFRQSNIAEQESEIINDSLSAILDLYNQNIESKNKSFEIIDLTKKIKVRYRYNSIIIFNVLEHVSDFKIASRNLYKLLSDVPYSLPFSYESGIFILNEVVECIPPPYLEETNQAIYKRIFYVTVQS